MKLKYQIEVVLGCLIAVLSIWTMAACFQAFHEETDWAKVPGMSFQQLVEGRDTLIRKIAKPTNAADYFQILQKFADLEHAATKLEMTKEVDLYTLQKHGVTDGTFRAYETEFVNDWQRAKLGNDIAAYSQAHRAEVDKYMHSFPTIPNEQWKVDRFWKVFQLLLVLPLPLCIALYICRIKENSGSVLLEVFNWRFILASMIWVYGLPYYRNMDFRHQMRRCQQVASFFLVSAISCFAGSNKPVDKKLGEQKKDSVQSWLLTGTDTTVSDYVGSNDRVFHKGPVNQQTLTLTAPNGVYIGTFGSVPYSTATKCEDYGYEQDFSVGWNGTYRHFTFNPDVTYINLAPLPLMNGDAWQLSMTVARPFKLNSDTVTPYFWINKYVPVLGKAPKSGTFYRFGTNNGTNVGKFATNSSAEVMYDTGAFGNDRMWLAKVSATISRNFGHHLQLGVPVNFYTPMTHVTDGRKTQLTVGFGIAYHSAHR